MCGVGVWSKGWGGDGEEREGSDVGDGGCGFVGLGGGIGGEVDWGEGDWGKEEWVRVEER